MQKHRTLCIWYILLGFLSLSCQSFNEPEWKDDYTGQVIMLDAHLSDAELELLNENRFTDVSVPAKLSYYLTGGSSQQKHTTALIEAQGAGSRYFPKWGYTITLPGKESIMGLNKFNLSIQAYDKSLMRTALASYLYERSGFNVFKSSHAFLKLNEKDRGLYVLTERIEEDFFSRRSLRAYELIKVVFGAKFSFGSKNHLSDNFEKKIPDDKNFNNLAEFINVLDTVRAENIMTEAGRYLDIPEYLRYHAITSMVNNVDGLTNNFYLVKYGNNEAYGILPWDFDKSFDPAGRLGLYGENDIVLKLFKDRRCFELYKSIVRDILLRDFTVENLFPVIDSLYLRLNKLYYRDPWLGMNGHSLEKEVNILKGFIANRRLELISLLQQ